MRPQVAGEPWPGGGWRLGVWGEGGGGARRWRALPLEKLKG